MFYRSNQINKMADAPIAPVPLGGADPIAHAAPFVTPAEALGAEMVVIIDALMENNRRMMGVVVVVVYLRTFLELGVLPIGSGSAIRQIDRLRSSAQLKYRGMSSNPGPARYRLIA